MRALAQATVTVDLDKIAANARTVCDAMPGIEVIGVTKVVCGSPEVAGAMLAGGVAGIGESRLENIARLRQAGIDAPYWLLRAPTPAQAEETVRLAEVSLASEATTLAALDGAAARIGVRHRIVVMVDLGDLREGLMPAELPGFLGRVADLAHLDIAGIGTSLTCYGAIVPSEENLGELVALARDVETRLDRHLVVSGGMSSSIELAAAGLMPAGVTNLRIGESIILGVSTVTREALPGMHTDAVTLEAPVIECKLKPSAPRGEIAQDAFGGRPDFQDRGERWRAICALGRQDAPPEGLMSLDSRVEILGASSDHLILDVDALPRPPVPGEAFRFIPNYAATLALFTSSYVDKVYVQG